MGSAYHTRDPESDGCGWRDELVVSGHKEGQMADLPSSDSNQTSTGSPERPSHIRQAIEGTGFITPGNKFTVRGKDDPPESSPSTKPSAPTLPVSIYLDDEAIHEQVEAAVDVLLASADLRIEERDEPVIGSWFRRMRAGVRQAVQSPAGREAALTAAHAVDARVNLAQDAAITSTLLQNLGPVIASLQPTKDAVLRVGRFS
jgi:hypothetical protein